MWQNIIIDNTLFNFNINFQNVKSEVLINLTQWHYWWWFWFIFWWSFYFFAVSRTVRNRTLKTNPRINTSTSSHGKWGDILVCVVPIAWCANILINSSFIFKLIEWQQENSSLVIRIRGKQWYWVYKVDIKSFYNLVNVKKNNGDGLYSLTNKSIFKKPLNYNVLSLNLKGLMVSRFWNDLVNINYDNECEFNQIHSFKGKDLFIFKFFKNYSRIQFFKNFYNFKFIDESVSYQNVFFKKNSNALFSTDYAENIKNIGIGCDKTSLAITKNKIAGDFNLINFNTNFQKGSFSFSNIVNDYNHFTLKQKRLSSKFYTKNFFKEDNSFIKVQRLKNKQLLAEVKSYNNVRLSRTHRPIVLPTNTHLTAITNSYDVIHSWHVPGLGLKFDCIPGRATHHSFFIDNPGFYFGQCAEICGRYHHHMPIRMYALPFDQYLIWWNHFGFGKLIKKYYK